jgi:hypothetical protein
MPSAIGGLKPEYRGADIRCGLNERLGCGQTGLVLVQRMQAQRFIAAAEEFLLRCSLCR